MLRHGLTRFGRLRAQAQWHTEVSQSFSYSTRTPDREREISEARKRLAKFDAETIPKSICEVNFSRSSGPGGQNVNKVNSKATLRVGLDELEGIVPALLHAELKSSPYYARNTHSLLISSSDSRKQQDNVQSCYRKLAALLTTTGDKLVPGETSDAQKNRVKGLQKVDNERRLKMKKMQSSKKSARRGDGD